MANVNQRIIDEYNQAQTLDALQRARRQMGAEIAAQDPAYFQPNIAGAGQPMYPLDNRINDIYAGADILASDNRVTGKVARTLNDMGVPLAAIDQVLGLLDVNPTGSGYTLNNPLEVTGVLDYITNNRWQPYALDSSPRPQARPEGLLGGY